MKTCIDIAQDHGFELTQEHNQWYKMTCPRHDDRSPSLRIAPDGSHWKCMVCNRGGQAYHLVRWITNCSAADAMRVVMDGSHGDPVLLYQLQDRSVKDETLPARIGAWALRYSLLTREQMDDIMLSDHPEPLLEALVA